MNRHAHVVATALFCVVGVTAASLKKSLTRLDSRWVHDHPFLRHVREEERIQRGEPELVVSESTLMNLFDKSYSGNCFKELRASSPGSLGKALGNAKVREAISDTERAVRNKARSKWWRDRNGQTMDGRTGAWEEHVHEICRAALERAREEARKTHMLYTTSAMEAAEESYQRAASDIMTCNGHVNKKELVGKYGFETNDFHHHVVKPILDSLKAKFRSWEDKWVEKGALDELFKRAAEDVCRGYANDAAHGLYGEGSNVIVEKCGDTDVPQDASQNFVVRCESNRIEFGPNRQLCLGRAGVGPVTGQPSVGLVRCSSEVAVLNFHMIKNRGYIISDSEAEGTGSSACGDVEAIAEANRALDNAWLNDYRSYNRRFAEAEATYQRRVRHAALHGLSTPDPVEWRQTLIAQLGEQPSRPVFNTPPATARGRCFDIPYASRAAGANVETYPCHRRSPVRTVAHVPVNNQHFYFGSDKVRAGMTNFCLTVERKN